MRAPERLVTSPPLTMRTRPCDASKNAKPSPPGSATRDLGDHKLVARAGAPSLRVVLVMLPLPTRLVTLQAQRPREQFRALMRLLLVSEKTSRPSDRLRPKNTASEPEP